MHKGKKAKNKESKPRTRFLRDKRLSLGYSMFELAILTGTTQSGIASMEQRDRLAFTIEGIEVAKVLGLPMPTAQKKGKPVKAMGSANA